MKSGSGSRKASALSVEPSLKVKAECQGYWVKGHTSISWAAQDQDGPQRHDKRQYQYFVSFK